MGGTPLVVTGVIVAAVPYKFEITYGDVFVYPTPEKLAALFTSDTAAKNPDSLKSYDYSFIEGLLKGNTLNAFKEGTRQEIGNVLLTGATGFLGIHILREYLLRESGIVTCMLRRGRFASVESRLKASLFYYFNDDFAPLFGKRIFVAEGDITEKSDFYIDTLKGKRINAVINCAANVKHFSKGTDIEDVNFGGVLNIIDYCKYTGSRLIHVSTTSVAGFSIDDSPAEDTVMNERMLYFGQSLDTKYERSKFLAERTVLEEIKNGLNAKIMRVGNLAPRETDGEIQMNFNSNSFVGRLKSYRLIGAFPYDLMNVTAEFGPVDYTAAAILALSRTPKECCVFHPYNNHSALMGDIILAMKKCGIEINLAENEAFSEVLKQAAKDPEKIEALSSMISYQNMGHGKRTVSILKSNDYTMQALYRLGFSWMITDDAYMARFINALVGMGFFSEGGENV